jgi:hypothetical protein
MKDATTLSVVADNPQPSGAGPQAPGQWGPGSGEHVLPALKTGILSTASTLGNLAAMAIKAPSDLRLPTKRAPQLRFGPVMPTNIGFRRCNAK